MTKILFDEVIFIESKTNYCLIQLKDKGHLVYMTLKELQDKLPAEQFIRVHKSYVVAYDKVETLQGNELIMENGARVFVGAVFRDAILEKVQKRLYKSDRIL